MLIDIQGVNNAWIVYSDGTKDSLDYANPLPNEVPIYINKKEDKLSLDSTDRFGNVLNRLKVRGLNKVIVELGEDMVLGKLKDVTIDYAFSQIHLGIEHFVAAEVALEFKDWNAPKSAWLSLMSNPAKITLKALEVDENKILVTIHKTSNITESLVIEITIIDPLEVALAEVHFNVIENVAAVIGKFKEKMNLVEAVYTEINNNLIIIEILRRLVMC